MFVFQSLVHNNYNIRLEEAGVPCRHDRDVQPQPKPEEFGNISILDPVLFNTLILNTFVSVDFISKQFSPRWDAAFYTNPDPYKIKQTNNNDGHIH